MLGLGGWWWRGGLVFGRGGGVGSWLVVDYESIENVKQAVYLL